MDNCLILELYYFLSKGMRVTFKYVLTSFVLSVVGGRGTIYWVSVEEMVCLSYDIQMHQ